MAYSVWPSGSVRPSDVLFHRSEFPAFPFTFIYLGDLFLVSDLLFVMLFKGLEAESVMWNSISVDYMHSVCHRNQFVSIF